VTGILYKLKIKVIFKNKQKLIYNDSRAFDRKSMLPEQYFNLPSPSQKDIENENHKIVSGETSRDLMPVQINNATDVLRLRDNNEIRSDNQVKIQNNNFMSQENAKEASDTHLKNTDNLKKSRKIIVLADYDALSPQELLKYDKRTTMTFLKDILTIEHSLLSLLFQRSLKNPAFIRLLQLTFSLSIQFAFNALLITDDYIDQRTNNPKKVIIKITFSSKVYYILYGIN
jgi:hypothetical protein